MGMNFGGNRDSVVRRDGEIMVEDPGRWAGAWTTAQVGRKGVEVSHMAMSQQEVVTRAIYIMRYLKDKEFGKIKEELQKEKLERLVGITMIFYP